MKDYVGSTKNMAAMNIVSTLWVNEQLSGVQVHLHTGRSLTENTIPDAVLIQSDLLMMSTELFETCRGL